MSDTPKLSRTKLFLEHIYSEFPILKKHPDYKFFYFYSNKDKITESLFCVVNTYLSNSNVSQLLDIMMETKKDFFNFTHSGVINEQEFLKKQDQYNQLLEECRKTEHTIVSYEVW
jgi:hypothetical protein